MFEAAETGRKIGRQEFKEREAMLREALLDVQFRLKRSRKFSYVILMSGVEAGGKGTTTNLLLEWLDARELETHALGDPSEEEQKLPFKRFWDRLPSAGQGAIFLGSWYTEPIIARATGRMCEEEFQASLEEIRAFEKMLSLNGVVIIKLWLHLDKATQRARLERLACDPEQNWRITHRDWKFHRLYDSFREVSARALEATSSDYALWNVVDASQKRYRHTACAEIIRDSLLAKLDALEEPRAVDAGLLPPEPGNLLRQMDLSAELSREAYKERLDRAQGELGHLARELAERGRSIVLVFEGMDAAGKGGAIRRITHALDARFYRVVSIAAPTEEEKSRPYLWRFWSRLPEVGRVTIFDRSWYGRVLVERVEGFCGAEDWQRAYAEINDFERQVADAGTVLIKFWLNISEEEQLRRFKAREATGYKRHKLTEEDWRNRDKAPLYERAICEMLEKTHTEKAPWVLVEAEQKHFARVKVLETLCEALKKTLGRA